MNSRPACFGLSALGASVAVFVLAACSADAPGNASGTAGSNEQAGATTTLPGGASAGGSATPSGGSSAGVAPTTSGTSSGGAAGGESSSGGTVAGGRSNSGGRGGSGGSSAGGASTGGAGGSAPATGSKPSAGCTTAAAQDLNKWVESMVMTGGANRPYSVLLPNNYDPGRAYPVIVLLHGCGSGTNNVPMEKATGTDAILVRGTGSAASTCWDSSATGKDVAFFDSMVADVKARFCADESRFFVVGYSSGSWLVNQLTCIRADVLRGAATVTGGESSSGKCGVPVARIFIHDTDDTDNVISGSEKARDRQLTQNACDKSVATAPYDPSPCVSYPGCPAADPVVWCQTSGQKHGRQDSVAPNAFWKFFKAL